MFRHVVIFKLRSREMRGEAIAALESLPANVPTLRSLTVGADTLDSARAADLCLITEFDDLDGYRVYQTHPAHLEVLATLKPLIESAVVVDW